MKKSFVLLFSLLMIIACTKQKIIKEYYPDGKILKMQVYANKNDTLNYEVLHFFNTGELLSRWTCVNGHREGGFRVFTPKGIIVEQGTYKEGKKDGVYLEYDTTGILTGDSYFINNKKVIYADSWYAKDRTIFGQNYYSLKHDTAYAFGQIAKETKGDKLIKEMSWYSSITSKDTLTEFPYCITLNTFFPIHCDKYEVTFGTPDINLEFNHIDTSFVTTDSVIKICDLKLNPGTNHIFCKVQVFSEYKTTFYAYKDVYINR
jgi:hypothetical protein